MKNDENKPHDAEERHLLKLKEIGKVRDAYSTRLKELNEQVQGAAHTIQLTATNAIRSAWNAGKLLKEVKSKLDHGQYIPFVESCGISRVTATKYVAIHANIPESSLSDFNSLRQAYMELGLIPERKIQELEDGEGKLTPAQQTVTVRVARLTNDFLSILNDEKSIQQIPKQELMQLYTRLTQILKQ